MSIRSISPKRNSTIEFLSTATYIDVEFSHDENKLQYIDLPPAAVSISFMLLTPGSLGGLNGSSYYGGSGGALLYKNEVSLTTRRLYLEHSAAATRVSFVNPTNGNSHNSYLANLKMGSPNVAASVLTNLGGTVYIGARGNSSAGSPADLRGGGSPSLYGAPTQSIGGSSGPNSLGLTPMVGQAANSSGFGCPIRGGTHMGLRPTGPNGIGYGEGAGYSSNGTSGTPGKGILRVFFNRVASQYVFPNNVDVGSDYRDTQPVHGRYFWIDFDQTTLFSHDFDIPAGLSSLCIGIIGCGKAPVTTPGSYEGGAGGPSLYTSNFSPSGIAKIRVKRVAGTPDRIIVSTVSASDVETDILYCGHSFVVGKYGAFSPTVTARGGPQGYYKSGTLPAGGSLSGAGSCSLYGYADNVANHSNLPTNGGVNSINQSSPHNGTSGGAGGGASIRGLTELTLGNGSINGVNYGAGAGYRNGVAGVPGKGIVRIFLSSQVNEFTFPSNAAYY
jgi:hypothetical protein